jgi:hypothetical protein
MSYREDHTTEWRAREVFHAIDAGFVHLRRIEAVLGTAGMAVIDDQIRQLPSELPEWQRVVRIHHIYVRTMLMWCRTLGVKTLGEVLAERKGRVFCSNVEIGPCRFRENKRRAVNRIVLPYKYPQRVELHYSTQHIYGDTPRERLRDGGFMMSVIAELQKADSSILVFDPIVIGSPWLQDIDEAGYRAIEWHASDYYEHFVEDFDEFSRVNDIPRPEIAEIKILRQVDETAVKSSFCSLLGDAVGKDWGGESSDDYTSQVRIGGRRFTAAFAFKGPARFSAMGLNHLGKNNDQIVRLASEPSDVLVVQHCHEILPPVRQTLRAFAVQPSRPRRYCLIDGRDTLHVLRAYGLLDKAIQETAARRSQKHRKRSQPHSSIGA